MDVKLKEIPYKDAIRIRQNKELPYIYDIEIINIKRLKKYHSIECSVVLYPLSRKLTSEDIEFFPFEEYIEDISTYHQKSAYEEIKDRFNIYFGITLGLFIVILFAIFKPAGLLELQSLVSIAFAYVLGKEIGEDCQNVMIDVSKKWRLHYKKDYYSYRLEKYSTLNTYLSLAREEKYGELSLMPEKMDFIKQSNSKIVRMYFDKDSISSFYGSMARILSIQIKPSIWKYFQEEGFVLSVKLTFNKGILNILHSFELFQLINKGSKGCLDKNNKWMKNSIFYKESYRIGRIKYTRGKRLIKNKSIIQLT